MRTIVTLLAVGALAACSLRIQYTDPKTGCAPAEPVQVQPSTI